MLLQHRHFYRRQMKADVSLACSEEIVMTAFHSHYLFGNILLHFKHNINIKDRRRLSKTCKSSLVKHPKGIPDQ